MPAPVDADTVETNKSRGMVEPDMPAICRALPGKYKRVPTRCAPLDRLLRGGLQTSRLAILAGGPGVTKTGIATFLMLEMAQHGSRGKHRMDVTYIAADEPRDGILSRVGQMFGQERWRLEDEDVNESGPAWEDVAIRLEPLSNMRVCDTREDGATVEEICALAVAKAKASNSRCVIFVDSIQAAKFACDVGETGEKSVKEKLDARMQALREVTVSHRATVIAISELNRGGYGNGKRAGLDSLKESGALEYGADVVIALERVSKKQSSELIVHATILKSRLGDLGEFRMRRVGCKFEEIELPSDDEPERIAVYAERSEERVRATAGRMMAYIRSNPGVISTQDHLTDVGGGAQTIRNRAVRYLLSHKLIVGGRGKPYQVVEPTSVALAGELLDAEWCEGPATSLP